MLLGRRRLESGNLDTRCSIEVWALPLRHHGPRVLAGPGRVVLAVTTWVVSDLASPQRFLSAQLCS